MKMDIKKVMDCGIPATKVSTALHIARQRIDYLYTHNKNLTKEQWFSVEELRDIINAIEE